ncbi:MAG TPA: DUF4296 domain-containing protein [Chitinophagaceae bacterium]
MRKISVFFLLAGILLGNACNRADGVPGGILSTKEMKAILLDMQLADAYNQQIQFLPDTINPVERPILQELKLKKYYAQILQLHHTNREEFLESYHYYEAHPDLLQKVYSAMAEEIKQTRTMLDSIQVKQQARRDSLRRKADSLMVKTDSLHRKGALLLTKKDTAAAKKDTTGRQWWDLLIKKKTKSYRLDSLWKSMKAR